MLNGELCQWFDKLEFFFLYFPFIKNYTLLFALPFLSCLFASPMSPVCKPPLPLKEEFSLWDLLDYSEKVDKSDTKHI